MLDLVGNHIVGFLMTWLNYSVTGFSDNVKCFYCNGGLRNWEKGDDPWHEHARWFPTCRFVLNVKGQDYVNAVRAENQDAPILAQARRNVGIVLTLQKISHAIYRFFSAHYLLKCRKSLTLFTGITLRKHVCAIYMYRDFLGCKNEIFHFENFDIFSLPEPKAHR